MATHLCFPSCGGRMHFFFGVAHALRERCDVSKLKLEAISGTVYCMLSFYVNYSIIDMHKLWMIRLRRLKKHYPKTWLWHMYDMAMQHCKGGLTEDVVKRCKLNLAYTNMAPGHVGETVHRNSFKSMEDLLFCCVASGYIPFIGGPMIYKREVDGETKQAVDGQISLYFKQKRISSGKKLYIDIDPTIHSDWEQTQWFVKGLLGHGAVRQFNTGFKYAQNHIIPKLDRSILLKHPPTYTPIHIKAVCRKDRFWPNLKMASMSTHDDRCES